MRCNSCGCAVVQGSLLLAFKGFRRRHKPGSYSHSLDPCPGLCLCVSTSSLRQVHHFFKVGQPRAQGKAALLCLAQQLSEQLQGFADALLPVVEKHGNASDLSLLDIFDKYVTQMGLQ